MSKKQYTTLRIDVDTLARLGEMKQDYLDIMCPNTPMTISYDKFLVLLTENKKVILQMLKEESELIKK